jgi:hypothetical protein
MYKTEREILFQNFNIRFFSISFKQTDFCLYTLNALYRL